jgi:hypothetical protein
MLETNRAMAHEILFKHRHPNATPEFHYEIINKWNDPNIKRLSIMAFRGGAKSTLGEENEAIDACLGAFRNLVILGETSQRANDRLAAIKQEIQYNDTLIELFGELGGKSARTWNEDKIVLANGVCIQAFGRGQSFRGVKHLDWRPDRLWIDDLEDDASVKTPGAFETSLSWLLKVVFPGLDPSARIRMTSTPLAPKCIPFTFRQVPTWVTLQFPVEHIDENGKRHATWPDRYSLAWVDERKTEYARAGDLKAFAQEYMLNPEDPDIRAFSSDMFRVVPHVRTWHAVSVAYDPARSATRASATTGKAVFSWIGDKLIVWDGGGFIWKPSQMLEDIFKTDDEYSPINIGIEDAGLVEFINEPLRLEQQRRQQYLPLSKLKPPKGKLSFVRNLQPLFLAGQIEFAKDLPEAKAQLAGFPTGRIDFPNALAYALLMRPGQSVYNGFSQANIIEHITQLKQFDVFLVVNATTQFTTGVVCQIVRGTIRVLADYVHEGAPSTALGDIVRAAGVETRRAFRVFCPQNHFDQYDTIGLRAASKKVPVEVHKGGRIPEGRAELTDLLEREHGGQRRLLVVPKARWTLNALAGGYCFGIMPRSGLLTPDTVDGPYKVLMEGFESFAALMRLGIADAEDYEIHYATSPGGRRYITSMATNEPHRPSKDEWFREPPLQPDIMGR